MRISVVRTWGFALELGRRRGLRGQLLRRHAPVPSASVAGRKGPVPSGGLASSLCGLVGGLGVAAVAVLRLGRELAAVVVVRGEGAVGAGGRVGGQLDGDAWGRGFITELSKIMNDFKQEKLRRLRQYGFNNNLYRGVE